MRRMLCWVPEGMGMRVADEARAAGAHEPVHLHAAAGGAQSDAVVFHIDNRRVGEVVAAVQRTCPEARMSFEPQGALLLRPPVERAPEHVVDVTLRSPLELLLAGLQSIGSWRGFLAYAALAGAVVWLGLVSETIYLLTAAMLIAPFAGPAMNAALGTAQGDRLLLLRSVGRYAASIAVAIAVAALLTVVFDVGRATRLVQDVANLTIASVVLPLAAGAAGAVNLGQSERSSLVSGAATGMLVAASLAPPAGIVGMSVVLGRWDLLASAGFVLALQLVGINLSAALVFRLFGVRPDGVRYSRGSRPWRWGVHALTALAVVGLVALQVGTAPALQRGEVERRVADRVERLAEELPLTLLDVDARVVHGAEDGRGRLLVTAWATDVEDPAEATAVLESELARDQPELQPLVDLTVLGQERAATP